jgi:hypothetical protein
LYWFIYHHEFTAHLKLFRPKILYKAAFHGSLVHENLCWLLSSILCCGAVVGQQGFDLEGQQRQEAVSFWRI